MKNKWFACLITLLMMLLYAIYSVAESPDTISGVIKDTDNSPLSNTEISIFDGFAIRNIKSDSNGAYAISELPVSQALYAVIFYTKDGYVPEIINVKRGEPARVEHSIVMQKAPAKDKGYITGVIYQPIKGGRLKYQSGINNFGKERRVWLNKNGNITETKSNKDGHFVFEVSPGKYVLHAEGSREKPSIEATEGKTVIRNMRSGIVLVD